MARPRPRSTASHDWWLSERELADGLHTLGFRLPRHVLQMLFDQVGSLASDELSDHAHLSHNVGKGFDFSEFKLWLATGDADVDDEARPEGGAPAEFM